VLEAPGHARHRIGDDPVDHGDEQIELEGADLAVVDDLGRLGEVDIADDRGQRRVL
jgi:hypothetical protein